ncbi:Deuterolysin metalloprotease family-domain-containing protein [Stachybotrys elegans]|uniref:Neutral protease 2 n=1 Tax=Stachybotrys elegans TaxID=80388 RepID=A0A8K0T134_9HYPO|nr:Deuterolysin metalloprotease family-domain-containing protein [Stachybotrys elegans]
MKFFVGLTALVSLALAAPSKAPTPLDVKLEKIGNSQVKATVTNNGKNALKLFKSGTLLDSVANEKAIVTSGSETLEFDGLRLRLNTENLAEDAFQRIAAGESIEVTFDVAEVYDLSKGGKFDIESFGAFSFAEADSTTLVGSVPFHSNKLEAEVDGAEAAATRVAFHQKRTIVQSDCTGTRLTAIRTAISNCASLARSAQQVAASGSADKVTEYFKSSTSSVRNTVSTVFSRVASECGSTTSGVSRLYCSDVYGACSGGVIAYTLPSASYEAYCPYFFNNMAALSRTCHAQDQATTVIHEHTHLTQIRGTSDYGGYGYNFVRSLSASQNLNHADTYTLFAQSIYAGC